MKILRILLLLAPVLALAASDSTAKRGWLGVYTDELSKPMVVALDVDHGVLVTDVVDGSPAEKSGVEVGDIIVSLDGEQISDGSALRWAVRDRPNKQVVVGIRRRGKDRKLEATLGAREESGQVLNFEWPAMPREALREAKRALREVGPKLKMELEHSDTALDSLRQELTELKDELHELRRKMTERQKTE